MVKIVERYFSEGSAIPPGLYLVSTPIGNARDITLRALDTLAGADALAAEDTRNARKLLGLHGLRLGGRLLYSYSDHNAEVRVPQLIALLREGKSVALLSDAGTPMISDPGLRLVRASVSEGIPVIPVPGASALLSALCLSALPTDRFIFAGFAPSASGARKNFYSGLADARETIVIFESPKRLRASIEDMIQSFGGERQAAACREITKKFEEARRGTLAEIAASFSATEPRGEFTIVIGGAAESKFSDREIRECIAAAMEEMSVRDAAAFASSSIGVSKSVAYRIALELKRELSRN
ncbi:MAG: 16S rRNA (cytidine(1402)-2'-O)-methyltransferase [Albidovulum sp.]|nr:16S rRNA (cytidine(1402)-2'-O)-methyltransferase [Albidovulum sp.]